MELTALLVLRAFLEFPSQFDANLNNQSQLTYRRADFLLVEMKYF